MRLKVQILKDGSNRSIKQLHRNKKRRKCPPVTGRYVSIKLFRNSSGITGSTTVLPKSFASLLGLAPAKKELLPFRRIATFTIQSGSLTRYLFFIEKIYLLNDIKILMTPIYNYRFICNLLNTQLYSINHYS